MSDEKEYPKITEEHLTSIIKRDQYHTFASNTLTICILTLKNGTVITGESACVSPENFVQKTGQEIAYRNAFEKLWMLEGYLLKEKIYEFDRGIRTDIGM